MNAANFELSDFLRRMRRTWRSYAYFKTRSHDDADDLIQEASEEFIIYYRKGNVHPGSERPYFATILRHRIYAFYRKRERQPVCVEPANLEFALKFEENHAERLEMERIQSIFEAVLAGNDLKGRTRDAFGLVRIMGLSYSQAGKRLGCGKATICRNLATADRILAKRL